MGITKFYTLRYCLTSAETLCYHHHQLLKDLYGSEYLEFIQKPGAKLRHTRSNEIVQIFTIKTPSFTFIFKQESNYNITDQTNFVQILYLRSVIL